MRKPPNPKFKVGDFVKVKRDESAKVHSMKTHPYKILGYTGAATLEGVIRERICVLLDKKKPVWMYGLNDPYNNQEWHGEFFYEHQLIPNPGFKKQA